MFEFDQAMTASPLQFTIQGVVRGNYEFSPAHLINSFTGSWSADRRTLTFQPSLSIALKTVITWTLNPAGATTPLRSVLGQFLETTTGSYSIAPDSGGSPLETCVPVTPAPGVYTISKFLQSYQTGPNVVDPLPANPAVLAISVQGPAGGPAVTGGGLTLPDGSAKPLLLQVGAYRRTEPFANEAALQAAYPPGAYTLRFTRTGEPEQVIPLTMPAMPTVTPKVLNFAEAQAIDASKDFTVRWEAFSPQPAGAFVRLVISDEFANRIFLAPNACVPRTLDPAATSIVIPANYLRPGFNYTAQLIFGLNYYSSTTDVPQMSGNAFVQRITTLTIKTANDPGAPPLETCDPPIQTRGYYTLAKTLSHRQLTAGEVLPGDGNPGVFTASVQGPPTGPAVTDASLTLPGGAPRSLTSQASVLSLVGAHPTELALEEAFPIGGYTLRFNQTGQPERVVAMDIPAAPSTVPMILNFAEAQTIDPASEFTLRWNAFEPAGPGAFIRIVISDERGKLIFMAPNICIPRTIEASATSVAIPADYFSEGVSYYGLLVFGFEFYNSDSAVPQMNGYGLVQRSTSFMLRAGGSDPVPGAPANFSSYRLLSNGHPEFRLSGTAGRAYQVQRAGALGTPGWTDLAPVTLDASGSAVFEDADVTLKFPAFYRAVSN